MDCVLSHSHTQQWVIEGKRGRKWNVKQNDFIFFVNKDEIKMQTTFDSY